MQTSWNDGYVTDIDYTFGYYRELNPIYLDFCLLLNGYKSPITNAQNGNVFTYCELGFGQGISLNIHAAANANRLNCFGTDFNPAQTAFANELANFNGSQNIHCYDDSFADFLQNPELPNFDYITLHGIWTWISRENQQHIVNFISKKLKPGGVVYVSYNALPGRNYELPFQKLLNIHGKFFTNSGDNAADRVDNALNFANKIFTATKNNENLVEKITNLKNGDKHYINHEYFNKDWNCDYFCDVAEKMEQAKLNFACRSDLAYLSTDLLLGDNEKAKRLLNRISQPIAKEQTLDFLINCNFRRDIYVKGLRKISIEEQQKAFSNTYFLNTVAAGSVLPKIGNLNQEIYTAIFGALLKYENSPKTLKEILDLAPKNLDKKTLTDGLILLVTVGLIHPCKNVKNIGKKEITNAQNYNQQVCQMAFKNNANNFLISPITGGAVNVAYLHMILLSQIYDNPNNEFNATLLAKFAFTTYQNFGIKHYKKEVSSDGKEITIYAKDDNENFEFIQQATSDFLHKQIIILKSAKVI